MLYIREEEAQLVGKSVSLQQVAIFVCFAHQAWGFQTEVNERVTNLVNQNMNGLFAM
jgi:hypothetical protein